jgi:antitoxin HicB
MISSKARLQRNPRSDVRGQFFCDIVLGASERYEQMARAKAVQGETYTYTVVFEPDEDAGGYTVTCPALPGLVTEGDTLEEARAMAADAIRCYLESLRKDGETIPLSEEYETLPIRESVTVSLEPS